MAKKSVIATPKKKAVRATKSETFLVNRKYLGDEPTYENFDRIMMMTAINWYNSMAEESDARQYIEDYFKSIRMDKEIKKLKRVPYMRIPTSAAWVFRMHMRGADIDRETLENSKNKILQILKFAEEEKKEETPVVRLSIQDHIANKVSDFIGDIEHTIDNLPEDFSMYKTLQSSEFPANLATKVADYYRPIMQEISDAIDKKDEQLVEAYSKYTKPQMKKLLALYTSIVEDCEKYSGNLRKARAPRKKKVISNDKKLKFFQYQKQDNSLKLTSVNPESIFGAQELWTFNTKNKTLTVFRARGPAGLDVKRTAIVGYDEEASVSKKIGRKTEDTINKVLNGGKIILRKLFDEINTESIKISDRINSNTILLKVVK
jgi:hypothetical protein